MIHVDDDPSHQLKETDVREESFGGFGEVHSGRVDLPVDVRYLKIMSGGLHRNYIRHGQAVLDPVLSEGEPVEVGLTLPVEQIVQSTEKTGAVYRFRQVVERMKTEGFRSVLRAGGEEHDRDVAVRVPDLCSSIESAHLTHVYVQEHCGIPVRSVRLHERKRV